MTSQHPVIAIDIVLEPDDTMISHAREANAGLVRDYPGGFTLDAAHTPHISLLQRYIVADALEDVADAVASVLHPTPIGSWALHAIGCYYLPWQDAGLAGIVIERSEPLLELQRALIDAIGPYVTSDATAEAFVTTAEDPTINQATIDYVAQFVPNASGDRFNPHVSIGMGSKAQLDALVAAPFSRFTFGVASASAFQLGNFGVAAKKLLDWQFSG